MAFFLLRSRGKTALPRPMVSSCFFRGPYHLPAMNESSSLDSVARYSAVFPFSSRFLVWTLVGFLLDLFGRREMGSILKLGGLCVSLDDSGLWSLSGGLYVPGPEAFPGEGRASYGEISFRL